MGMQIEYSFIIPSVLLFYSFGPHQSSLVSRYAMKTLLRSGRIELDSSFQPELHPPHPGVVDPWISEIWLPPSGWWSWWRCLLKRAMSVIAKRIVVGLLTPSQWGTNTSNYLPSEHQTPWWIRSIHPNMTWIVSKLPLCKDETQSCRCWERWIRWKACE